MQCLDTRSLNQILTSPKQKQAFSGHKDRRWCCAVCAAMVSAECHAIAVNDRHEHFKTNPQGRTFAFKCFRTAQGCKTDGVITAEFSWFQGYRWDFAYCRNCKIQLGWRFVAADEFFGLISEQIKPCDDNGLS